jgi:hypothetical protein
LDLFLEVLIDLDWDGDAGEEVLNDGIEEGQIVFKEFGDVGVTHGFDQDDVFLLGWVCAF